VRVAPTMAPDSTGGRCACAPVTSACRHA